MTNPTPTTPAPQFSRIRIFGKATKPEWSVQVAETTSEEELDALVDRAVHTYHLVGERLAAVKERK